MGNQSGKGRKQYAAYNSRVPLSPKRKKKTIDSGYGIYGIAECPAPPGRPEYIDMRSGNPLTDLTSAKRIQDGILLVWDPPVYDGGCLITGYFVEKRDLRSDMWVRVNLDELKDCECMLNNLDPGGEYIFRVSAENVVGMSLPGEPSEPIRITYDNVATPPYFIKDLRDTAVMEHERVAFSVQVAGTPSPRIVWYKDGFEIFHSAKAELRTEGEFSVLLLNQVRLDDEGEIKCTASNRAGESSTIAQLHVEAPPRIQVPKKYEDGLLFESDEPIRLKLQITGRPLPVATWYHNNQKIDPGGRYEIENTDKEAQLKVSSAKRQDRGEYCLRLESDLGEDAAFILVTVTDRPQPPGQPKVKMIEENSCILEWAEPKDDGGCKIGCYIVEYFRNGWDVWLKAVMSRQLTTKMHELIAGSEYKFRVKAENPYGISEPSEESATIFIPDPQRGITNVVDLQNVTSVIGDGTKMNSFLQEDEPSDLPERPVRRKDIMKAVVKDKNLHIDTKNTFIDTTASDTSELMLVLLPGQNHGDQEREYDLTSENVSVTERVLEPEEPFISGRSESAPNLGQLVEDEEEEEDESFMRNAVSSVDLVSSEQNFGLHMLTVDEVEHGLKMGIRDLTQIPELGGGLVRSPEIMNLTEELGVVEEEEEREEEVEEEEEEVEVEEAEEQQERCPSWERDLKEEVSFRSRIEQAEDILHQERRYIEEKAPFQKFGIKEKENIPSWERRSHRDKLEFPNFKSEEPTQFSAHRVTEPDPGYKSPRRRIIDPGYQSTSLRMTGLSNEYQPPVQTFMDYDPYLDPVRMKYEKLRNQAALPTQNLDKDSTTQPKYPNVNGNVTVPDSNITTNVTATKNTITTTTTNHTQKPQPLIEKQSKERSDQFCSDDTNLVAVSEFHGKRFTLRDIRNPRFILYSLLTTFPRISIFLIITTFIALISQLLHSGLMFIGAVVWAFVFLFFMYRE